MHLDFSNSFRQITTKKVYKLHKDLVYSVRNAELKVDRVRAETGQLVSKQCKVVRGAYWNRLPWVAQLDQTLIIESVQ